MELISCGKSFQVHSFPSLATVSSFGGLEKGYYDFQFFRKSKFFIASNPQAPAVEYLSVKSQEGRTKISQVKRIRTESLRCVACPKSSLEYVALGCSTGHTRLLNYKTAEVAYRFSPDGPNNSILHMDFSSTDKYLATIAQSGKVKLFGMRSFTEVDSFNIDENSTFARFHPLKRFQLVVTSFLGSVTIYDAQVKKKVFHIERAHTCPCRDVAMSSINDTCLFSVGYDCYVNVYDTRKKTVAQQLRTEHPLSAIALSPTSMECVVGNLKGEILTFDVRNMGKTLATVRAHENLVNRLTFVPSEKMEVDFPTTSSVSEPPEESSGEADGESLNDSVDVFSLVPTITQNRASVDKGRRDSVLDFLMDRMDTMPNTPQLLDSSVEHETSHSRSRRSEEAEKDLSRVTLRKKRSSVNAEPKLSDVKEIEESEEANGQDNLMVVRNAAAEVDSPLNFLNPLPDYRNSTPKAAQESAASLAITADNVVEEVAKMVKRTEHELKWEMNTLKWHTYGEMFSLWQNQNRLIEDLFHKLEEKVEDNARGLGMLMNLISDSTRLQDENERLKAQLAAMKNRFDG